MRDVAEGVELRVLGLIGFLPLTSSIVLNLRPKFPLENTWEMLISSDEKYASVLPILRMYGVGNSAAPHQILLRGFCFFLRNILALGTARSYHYQNYEGFYRPKVNFGRTVARFVSRGNEVKVESHEFVISQNIQANQLLKSACLDFIKLLPSRGEWLSEKAILLDALNTLSKVDTRLFRYGDQFTSDQLPKWLRLDYFGALSAYAIFLGHHDIGFHHEPVGSKLPSFLFSLDSIFESFVRNSLRLAFRDEQIAVSDGNLAQNQSSLFTDNKRFPVKPDMIFRHKKVILGIGEIKYKPRLDESDRYQLISHTLALQAPVGIWVSPALAEATSIEYIGSVSGGIRFFHCRINIAGKLSESLVRMVSDIRRILSEK
ncbi:MAG: 5-methylcytosine restriction system specificity protein McrC [Alphaproteobacteria bacterium]